MVGAVSGIAVVTTPTKVVKGAGAGARKVKPTKTFLPTPMITSLEKDPATPIKKSSEGESQTNPMQTQQTGIKSL